MNPKRISWEEALKRADLWGWPIACNTAQIISRGASALRNLLGIPPREKPLIVRPGGMGDLICLQMAMENLGLDPAHYDWILETRSLQWAKYQKLSATYYDRLSLPDLLSRFGAYQKVYNSEQYFGLSQGLALACVSPRGHLAGFATNRASGFLNQTIPYDAFSTHEVLSFEHLLAPYELDRQSPHHRVRPRRAAPQGMQCVGIGGFQSPSRSLPLSVWQSLIAGTLDLAKPIVLLGAPVDQKVTLELFQLLTQSHAKIRASVFEGTFADLCACIAGADRLLSVDSGMVHLASYFGVPTTAVFTSGRDLKWAPLAPDSQILKRRDLGCQPCTLFGQVPPCEHQYACKDLGSFTKPSRKV